MAYGKTRTRSDDVIVRKVNCRLYPSRATEVRLLDLLELHRDLYNAALQQRIWEWRTKRRCLGYSQQCRELTRLRAEDERYHAVNAQSAQATLHRLELAFQSFFRRHKKGETPGFPRFRSAERFSGWGYKKHGQGFRVRPFSNNKSKLQLFGVGLIPMRGKPRNQGIIRTCEIRRSGMRWYCALTMECCPKRQSGSEAVGLDWGVSTFLTVAYEGGRFLEIANPRFLKRYLKRIRITQQRLSLKKRRSRNYEKMRGVLTSLHLRIANRRRDFLHRISSQIVAAASLIATEGLHIKQLTSRRPRCSGEVSRAALNREILCTAPSLLLAMLRYKAAEAGIRYVEIPTRIVKPTQRCSRCWTVSKKSLRERRHDCRCGLNLRRDRNAARVSVLWALATSAGDRPSAATVGGPHEAQSWASMT